MDTKNNRADKPNWAPDLPKPLMWKLFKKFGLALFPYRKSHVYCSEKFVRKAWKIVGTEEIPPFAEMAKEVVSHNKTLLGDDRLYTLYQPIISVKTRPSKMGASLK